MSKALWEEQQEKQFPAVMELTPYKSMTITKITPANFHKTFMDRVEAGETSVLQYVESVSFFEKVKEVMSKDEVLRETVRDVIKKGGGDRLVTARGVTFEIAETGTQYDFTKTSAWNEYTRQIKELTDKRKELEAFLKTIAPGKEFVDPETGEIFYGAAKSSTSSFKLTFSK